MRRLVVVFSILVLCAVAGAADPLPSWRDGEAKSAIADFVAAVSDPDGAEFVPVAERVAVIDNDGTAWCERPNYASTEFQVQLMRSRAALGKVDAETMPYRAWLADDRDALKKYGWNEAYQALIRSFAGMPVAAFGDSARAFLPGRVTNDSRCRTPISIIRPCSNSCACWRPTSSRSGW